jgi:ABC-type polysaccharide/polyol phosphate transport system ATPase subunit
MLGRYRTPRPIERPAEAPLILVEDAALSYDLRIARGNRAMGRRVGAAAWGSDREGYRHWAVHTLSLTVAPGESIGIIGGNGAGKTSLLSLMAGVIDPTHGRVTRFGRAEALIGIGTGMENALTGRENAALSAHLGGLRGSAARAAAEEAATFADLGSMIDAPVGAYSSGMRARLAFAMATATTPDLLFVDEVFSTGDETFRERAEARMNERIAQAGAVVMVSHDLSQIERRCSRVLLMAEGRLVFDGPTSAAIAAYRASSG